MKIAKFSAYTILHRDKLDQFYRDGGTGNATEGRAWVTISRFFHDGQKTGERVPVLFADAATTQGLIYFAFLTDVRVMGANNEGPTLIAFEGLTPIEGEPPKSTLIKRNGNSPLKDSSIRPYSIVYTPDFIRNS